LTIDAVAFLGFNSRGASSKINERGIIMPRYSGDPFWMQSRYSGGKCSRCGATITKGGSTIIDSDGFVIAIEQGD